jgi:SPW repeat
MRRWREESVLDLYNLVLAAILFVSPWFFLHASRTVAIDLGASSAAIVCLSLAAVLAFSSWEEWANLILSLWLIVSPWLLGFAHTRAMHFSIGIGLPIAFFTLLELWLRHEAAEREAMPSANGQKR